jgi:protein-tyrosine phosphatase
MVDLHCHLLPGIDDGPSDLEESVLMCRLAAAEGCEVMVTTPHQHHPNWWNGDRHELAELRRRLQERVGERPRLLPGAEIRVGFDFLGEVERLPGGSLQVLAGSRYLLIELDRRGMGPDPAAIVHELTVAGWRPIIAHPELYPWLMDEVELARHLVELGALLQVTAMSVTGEFGKRAEESCHRLLEEDLVHFVASDCHGCDYRPPGLRRAYATIAARWGERTARALTSGNPGAVIVNRPLPSPAFA